MNLEEFTYYRIGMEKNAFSFSDIYRKGKDYLKSHPLSIEIFRPIPKSISDIAKAHNWTKTDLLKILAGKDVNSKSKVIRKLNDYLFVTKRDRDAIRKKIKNNLYHYGEYGALAAAGGAGVGLGSHIANKYMKKNR